MLVLSCEYISHFPMLTHIVRKPHWIFLPFNIVPISRHYVVMKLVMVLPILGAQHALSYLKLNLFKKPETF